MNKNYRSTKKIPWVLIVTSLFAGLMAVLQNKYGQFSDIRGFYGLHFSDGQNQWPFSYHTLLGSTELRHPVEYPALTGLIMWVISFFIPISEMAVINYYWLTAFLNTLLFGFSAYLVSKLSDLKSSYYVILAPAVLYSLNRNWDIWALVPMLLALLYFEKKAYKKSAISLAIAIATKFFPVVLLLPIIVIFFQRKQFRIAVEYVLWLFVTWLIINLPFAVINFEGWFYFYKFSFERGLGSGSFFEIFFKLGIVSQFSDLIFYLLNLSIFGVVFLFYIVNRKPLTLVEASFYILFAFTLFNKQYSVQYIIWLAPFAVLAIHKIHIKRRKKLLNYYILWQLIELVFQYSLFQNVLTNIGNSREMVYAQLTVTDFSYAMIAALRYVVLLTFVFLLMRSRLKEKSDSLKA
jgi:uncharacterized membrane protein